MSLVEYLFQFCFWGGGLCIQRYGGPSNPNLSDSSLRMGDGMDGSCLERVGRRRGRTYLQGVLRNGPWPLSRWQIEILVLSEFHCMILFWIFGPCSGKSRRRELRVE